MMRHFITALFAFFAFVTPPAAADLYTGYWRQSDPEVSKGETFKCQLVTTNRDMRSILKQAGWNSDKQPFPSINWDNNEAIIISRDKFLDFYGIFLDGDKVILSYGWEEPREPESRADVTMMWSTVGRRSIIVVSYSKDIDENKEFFCRRR